MFLIRDTEMMPFLFSVVKEIVIFLFSGFFFFSFLISEKEEIDNFVAVNIH